MNLVDVQSFNLKLEAVADGGNFMSSRQVEVKKTLSDDQGFLFLFRFSSALNGNIDILEFIFRIIRFNPRKRI